MVFSHNNEDYLIKLLISFEQNKSNVIKSPKEARAVHFSFFMSLSVSLRNNEKKQSVLEHNMKTQAEIKL